MSEEVFEPELEPAEAAKIFGDRIELARGYARALIRDGDHRVNPLRTSVPEPGYLEFPWRSAYRTTTSP
jgi:hypothetical protein